MKKIFLSIVVFFSVLYVFAQSKPDIIWSKTMGGSSYEAFGYQVFDRAALALSSDEKSLYIGSSTASYDGFVKDSIGGLNGWLIKIDAKTGDTLWTYVPGGSGFDKICDVTATKDGGVIVCGSSNSVDGDFENKGLHLNLSMPDYDYTDGFIAKFSASGNLEWTKMYGGQPFIEETSVGTDELYKIINTSDGGYMAAGYTYSATDDIPIDLERFRGGWLLKVDKDGKIQHSDKFTGPNHNENNGNNLVDIVEAAPNLYYALGTQSYIIENPGTLEFQDFIWVIKTDGKVISEQKEYGNSVASNFPSGITLDDSGNIFASGIAQINRGDVSMSYGGYDFWVMKMNEDLDLNDEHTYGGTEGEYPYAMITDNKGHYLIPGYTNSIDYDSGVEVGGSDFWAVFINEDMDTLQTYRFGGTSLDQLNDAVFTKDGKILYVSGLTTSNDGIIEQSFGKEDIWVSAINQDVTLSVESEIFEKHDLTIYPNPSKGIFTVKNRKNNTYSISDITGRTIQKGKLNSEKQVFNLQNQEKGIYFIEINDNNLQKLKSKIVIN